MSNLYKSLLIKKFNAFEIEESFDRQKLLRFEIENTLKNEDKLDSEDYYIWGLIYYMTDDDIEYNLKRAGEKFDIAIEEDDNNFLARLYRAHVYHDLKDYQNALLAYQKVDKFKLKDFQLWRYVKLLEQIGICYFKIGQADKANDNFQEVLKWYKSTPSVDLAYPSEVIECLSDQNDIIVELRKHLSTSSESPARDSDI